MEKDVKGLLITFAIALPLTFVLLFLGYLPVHYDIVLSVDNVVGEGICQTYVCPTKEYASFYRLAFYFGSELETATIKGYHYDVDDISFVTSDVSEFDICSIDSYWKGIHLNHFDGPDLMPDGEDVEGESGHLYSRDGVIHVDVFDKNEGVTVSFGQPFIPIWFWAAYVTVYLIISVLISTIVWYVLSRVPALTMLALNATAIIVTLLAGCFFCDSLPYVTYNNFLLNWLFLFAFGMLLNAVTLPVLGTVLTMLFTTFWYIANYFVITLRNKPIMPADLKAIGTAAEVMGGYTFTPSWQMVLGTMVVVLYMLLLIIVYKRSQANLENVGSEERTIKTQLLGRGAAAAFAVFLMLIGVHTSAFKSLDTFAWDMVLLKSFHEEGMVTTYLKSVFNSVVEEPEGYSREIVSSYLAEYEADTNEKAEGIQPTNIIVVMNEAFSDLRTVGLNQEIDVMPFIDSLEEDTVEGSLYVGVFGGGTCNTEFEALTGNTLAFLSPGAYPYTENVTKPLFSLASYFKELGYGTTAFHANDAVNWNRNMAYPNLGFDTFNSITEFESFGEIIRLHDLPADITDYSYIEAVSAASQNQPRFLFDVTMQNHSGYERWLDVDKAETVAEHGSDLYVDTQIYLSLIKASDDEVRQLVETYETSDEPTMIVFFGDHQPGLPGVAIDEIYTDLKSNLDLYKSKFFIWTNYDTQEWHDAGFSANYLPWVILERGNFPLPPYVQMLKELYAKYPIISSQGVMDIDGNIYSGVAEVMDDPLIQKYQYVQYANLFDELDDAWFEVK